MIGVIQKFSKKPELRRKQYKHFRDVLVSQGYIAGAGVLVGCVCYDLGSGGIKKLAAETVLYMSPCAGLVLFGKGIATVRRVGAWYRIGTTAYNIGMSPVKIANFICQGPFVIMDMFVLGEPYVPKLNATFWSLGNITDDMETVASRMNQMVG